MILAQVDTLDSLVSTLQNGGPWAILSLAIFAIMFLARAYVKARDERDTAVSDLNDKLRGLLKDIVVTAEQQKASNEKIEDILDRIDRKLEKDQ